MRKILRVGLLAASLSGLVATMAPTPADATTVGDIVFRGVAVVGPHGIAYPLVDNSAPPPPLHLSTRKAAPFIHNSAVIETFGSTTCVGVVASNKSAPPPGKVTAGVCTIGPHTPGATGTVHGYCGLSDGTVNVIVSAGGFSYSVNVSFVAVGGQLVINGHWHKHGTTHSGPLVGTAHAAPDAAGIGGAGTGSCLSKARKAFIVVGAAAFGSVVSGSTASVHASLLSTHVSVHANSPPHLSLPKASSPVTASVSVG